MSKTVTRLFDSYSDATTVVRELESTGVPHSEISIVANNAHGEHDGVNDDGDVTRLAMLARRLDIRWVLTSAGTDSTAFEEALLGTACCLDAGTLAKTGRRAFEPMEPVCSDEVALLFLTSGSTGLPKATMLTHGGQVVHPNFIVKVG